VYSETIGGRPIKLVFFIRFVCSFISIASSSHYVGRQHLWRSSLKATEELPRQELAIGSGAQLTMPLATLSAYDWLHIRYAASGRANSFHSPYTTGTMFGDNRWIYLQNEEHRAACKVQCVGYRPTWTAPPFAAVYPPPFTIPRAFV
jgi:hypothetical protein